jgi:hypothetical protein
MEKIDIIILSSVVATLFLVFFIGCYKELRNVDENSYKYEKEGGPRVQLLNFVGSLFDDQLIPNEDKKKIYKAMNRTIEDMESDGLYFPQDVKEELKKRREELNCEYSGLPSPKAYENL